MLRIGASWVNQRPNRASATAMACLEGAFKPLPSGKPQSGPLPKYIFSRGPEPGSGTGLVQQTVQIVASHDLTLFVSHRCPTKRLGIHQRRRSQPGMWSDRSTSASAVASRRWSAASSPSEPRSWSSEMATCRPKRSFVWPESASTPLSARSLSGAAPAHAFDPVQPICRIDYP